MSFLYSSTRNDMLQCFVCSPIPKVSEKRGATGQSFIQKEITTYRISTLKPNACNNKARRIKFHRYVRQFLPRDHGGFGHKNQKMSDFLGIAQKVRHFLILVPKTAIVSWQKLSNISMELAVPNVVLLLTLL